MPTESQILSELLKGTDAKPYANPQRSAPSSIYDMQYRMFVIAACLRTIGRPDGAFRKIASNKLRLLQFVAMRPWLLAMVQDWSSTRKDPQRSLQSSQSLRRGFLSDSVHDGIVDYLVAAGWLYKQKGQIAEPLHASGLTKIHDDAVKAELFTTEQEAIKALDEIVITNDMLEGW
jgi:hypothetical protein